MITIAEVNTIAETERVLKISHQTVYALINSSVLKTYKVGRRRFVSGDAIRKFIVDREAEAG